MDASAELTASQRYYQNHKDQRKQYGREYYRKNRDKILKGLKGKKETPPTPVVEKPVVKEAIDASGCYIVSFS